MKKVFLIISMVLTMGGFFFLAIIFAGNAFAQASPDDLPTQAEDAASLQMQPSTQLIREAEHHQ